MPELEVCVADPESLLAAIEGGADRIELCSAIELGGLTPGPGLMALAAKVPIPVYAMVRPRSGDFVFGAEDKAAMLADIAAIRSAGLAGVVLGASTPDGSLDADLLDALTDAASGLGTTLHRAFDLVPDLAPAVELAVALGFERILTSGRAAKAMDGLPDLAETLRLAKGRIAIMAGSGLTPDVLPILLADLPLEAVHGTFSAPTIPESAKAVALGFAPPLGRRTSATEVRRAKQALPLA
jgi:copper homeostasis protein